MNQTNNIYGAYPTQDFKKYEDMGFTQIQIQNAIQISQQTKRDVLDILCGFQNSGLNNMIYGSNQQQQPVQNYYNPYNDNQNGQQNQNFNNDQFYQSLNASNSNQSYFQQKMAEEDLEPLNPIQRVRQSMDTPVGLKNVGNSCYFNSLIQVYFHVPQFVQEILRFSPNEQIVFKSNDLKQNDSSKEMEIKMKKRIQTSITMVQNLQKLFAGMVLCNKKYLDPSAVINNLLDDFGNNISVGDQKDISEYHLNFISRLEEALEQNQKNKNYQSNQKLAYLGSKSLNSSVIDSSFSHDLLSENIPSETQSMIIQDIQMSGRKIVRKSTISHNDNIISQLFFGNMKEIMTFHDQTGTKTSEKQILFSPIILDIDHKDLYSSWESHNHSVIDDFKNQSGQQTQIETSLWIQKAPKILFFQLQRVEYDKNLGCQVKKNDKFKFDKEIYIDQYLYENKSDYLENKKIIDKLKLMKQHIDGEIDKIQNFENSQINLIKILKLTESFLQNKAKSENIQVVKIQDLSFDLLDLKDSVDEKQIKQQRDDSKQAIATIQQQIKDYEAKLEELNQQRNKLKKQIKQIYQKQQQNKYQLISIMMHDGSAECGHYYSYNYDIQNKLWRKFNDINVSEEPDEQKILQEAYGQNQKSAYCLVYVSDKVFYDERFLNMNEFSAKVDNPQKQQVLQQIDVQTPDKQINNKHKNNTKKAPQVHHFAYNYQNHISNELKKYVESENKQFQILSENFKLIRSASQITDQYLERFANINQSIRTHNQIAAQRQMNYPPPIMNFATFLRSEENYKEEYFKWHLLDICIRKVSNNQVNIHDMDKYDMFVEQIKSNFQCLSPFQAINKFKLSQTESTCLDTALTKYIDLIILGELSLLLIKLCNGYKWIEAINLAGYVFNKTQNNQFMIYFTKFSRELIRIISLIIGQLIFKLKDTQTTELNDYLTALGSNLFYLSKSDIIILQVIKMLDDYMIKNQEKTDIKKIVQQHKLNLESYNTINQNTSRKDIKIYQNYITQKEQEFDKLKDKLITQKDFYSWEIDEESFIKQIMNQVEIMSQNQKEFIQFNTILNKERKILSFNDRIIWIL